MHAKTAELALERAQAFRMALMEGQGGYEGLSAYLVADWSPETGADMQGAIFSGEMPPVPEGFPAGE